MMRATFFRFTTIPTTFLRYAQTLRIPHAGDHWITCQIRFESASSISGARRRLGA
jgi:hypothetical protein